MGNDRLRLGREGDVVAWQIKRTTVEGSSKRGKCRVTL